MEKKKEKQQWYFNVALIVIIIILVVLIALQISTPAESSSTEQDEGTRGGNSNTTSQTQEDETEEVEVQAAKEFTLQDLNGEMVSLSDFKGTPVLLNFWATWCPPCIQEMPVLQKIADQFSEELVVIALNGGDPIGTIRAFAESNNYSLVFLADPENSISVEYQVKGFPTSFFIDAEGNIQGTYIGMMDENIISYYLEKMGIVE